MTEYWKSLPRKFCIYCKCWITDNKSSVEFHERGKNHQENVKKKLDELRKKGVKDAKEKESANSLLKAIEEAALKSAKEDIKRDPSLASLYGVAAVARASEAAPAAATPASGARAKAPSTAPKGGKRQSPAHVNDGGVRSSGSDPVDLESAAAVTPELMDARGAGVVESADDSQAEVARAEDAQADDTEGEWQKALSPEGYEYYWNVRTGESSWTLPNDEATTSAAIVDSAETTPAAESGTCCTPAEVASVSVTEPVRVTDAANVQPLGDETVSVSFVTTTLPMAEGEPLSISQNVSDQNVCIKSESGHSDSVNVNNKGVCVKSEPGNQDPTCDALRTVKTEIMAAGTVKAESDHAVSSARAAIAAASARLKAAAAVKIEGGIKVEAREETSNDAATHVKVERSSEVEEGTADDSASTDGAEELGKKHKVIEKRPPAAIKFSPYGRWVAVEPENPPAVDLELPTDATKYSVSAADIPLPEPVPVKDAPVQFKEKVVTLQGRHAGGGEVAFKKRKIGGAKNNSRRRDDEDE